MANQKQDIAPAIISKYRKRGPTLGIGNQCEQIGEDILKDHEHFEYVIKPEKMFRGQPFDRLARKEEQWYIVEIKGGRHGLGGTPSHTQKRRMREVLQEIPAVMPVLLQIDLENAKYKIRYGKKDVSQLIAEKDRQRLAIAEIIKWVKKNIGTSDVKSNSIKQVLNRGSN
jgi:hypothetical protein